MVLQLLIGSREFSGTPGEVRAASGENSTVALVDEIEIKLRQTEPILDASFFLLQTKNCLAFRDDNVSCVQLLL